MNHRIFERTLHSLVFRRVCLFECHETLNPPFCNEIGAGLDYGCLPALLVGSAEIYELSQFEIDGLTRRNNYLAEDVLHFK